MKELTKAAEQTGETNLESIKENLLKLNETELKQVSKVVNSFLFVQQVKSDLKKVECDQK